MRTDNSKTAVVYYVLGLSAVLLAAVVVFLLFAPKPLNTAERRLLGSWHATEQNKKMTFNSDRTVDITNTGVSHDVVFRWKLEGSTLAIKEGRGPWEHQTVEVNDGSFSVMRDGKSVLHMVRRAEAERVSD